MGQSLDRWVAVAPSAYGQMSVGPATLQIVQATTEAELTKALSPSTQAPPANPLGRLTLTWAGETRTIDVSTARQQPVAVGMGTVSVAGFWPDFRLNSDHQPVTASDQLLNPAVELVLTEGPVVQRWYVFSQDSFEPIPLATPSRSADSTVDLANAPVQSAELLAQYDIELTVTEPDAFFRVIVDTEDGLHYAARSSKGFVSGPLSLGETVTPGWADFTVTLTDYVANAQVKREVVPLPDGAPAEGDPALLVSAAGGTPTWVPWGEASMLNGPDGDWYVSFSPKLLQLPFGVKLDDFIVERNEGSESVAMWTSVVRLIDPIVGQVSNRRVWMNHPTWFKGWKLAQASWNPGDLNQSTLQVKREPWWVTGLTWLGSLMVTAGICVMFYGRAVAKKVKGLSNLLSDPNEDATENKSSGTIPIFGVFTGRS